MRRPVWKFECLLEDVREELRVAAEKDVSNVNNISRSSRSSATDGGTDAHRDDNDEEEEDGAREKGDGDMRDEKNEEGNDEDEDGKKSNNIATAEFLLKRSKRSKKLTPEEIKKWLGCDPVNDVKECIQVTREQERETEWFE